MVERAPAFASRVHGGVSERELAALGIDLHAVLDVSTSCNPFGPSPHMLEALATAAVSRYPDTRAARACDALARKLDLDPECIALGNGAAELLWTAARALLEPGTTLLIAEPAFSELRSAAERVGARVLAVCAQERDGFAQDLQAFFAAADSCSARVVYLCAPSSPVGAPIAAPELAALARERPGLSVILDESYLSLSERFADAGCAMPDNVLRVRSLTKEQGIPGVRVGYVIAKPTLISTLEAERAAWSVGAHAQAAAMAACESDAFVSESRARLLALRSELAQRLRAIGLQPLASSAGFLVVRVPHAGRLRTALLTRWGVLVRDCASFGLEGFVRIAARPEPDLERVCAALAEELPRCSHER
jgi:histidinol-phosphate/aromatic aminotransferase/cobyric acid decarboxylase-like protein